MFQPTVVSQRRMRVFAHQAQIGKEQVAGLGEQLAEEKARYAALEETLSDRSALEQRLEEAQGEIVRLTNLVLVRDKQLETARMANQTLRANLVEERMHSQAKVTSGSQTADRHTGGQDRHTGGQDPHTGDDYERDTSGPAEGG